jgi:beta-galactosidase
MEEVGQATGLIHYRATVRLPSGDTILTIKDLRDRAQAFLDGKPVGVLHRNEPDGMLHITGTGDEVQLDLLAENQGRANFGPELADRKGILGGVLVGLRYVFGWVTRPLPLEGILDKIRFGDSLPEAGPAFYRASVTVDEPADAYLALPGWTKGFLWLNGFLLGRYWDVGPQRTLYAPAPLWRAGANELVALELHERGATIDIVEAPDLGASTPQQT